MIGVKQRYTVLVRVYTEQQMIYRVTESAELLIQKQKKKKKQGI
jgi:hypothetical protein